MSITDRFESLVDWLYPPRCRACAALIRGRDSEYFCRSCWGRIQRISRPLCTACGRPFLDASGEDHHCGSCLGRTPHFRWARAWACYPSGEVEDHPLRRTVQKFKYGRKVSLGKALGRLMAEGCTELLSACNPDLILPVPLHPKRLRWRGFNQSLLLARPLSRMYRIPVNPFILKRDRATPPQTQLSEEERRKNVRGAFSVRNPDAVFRKSILLVDDVYTSGATVNECSRVLMRAGAGAVFVLTLARAV